MKTVSSYLELFIFYSATAREKSWIENSEFHQAIIAFASKIFQVNKDKPL